MTKMLAGKRGLIMGVANERSIAWGIAKSMAEAGAELAFTYQGEAFGKRLEPLATSVGSDFMVDVDVTDDASLEAAFDALGSRWPTIDFVVQVQIASYQITTSWALQKRLLNQLRVTLPTILDQKVFASMQSHLAQ